MYIECRHIFTGGAKCKSPALTGHEFCYFHNRKRNRQTSTRRSGEPSTLVHNLPQLEDADAIQLALSDVVLALAANRIDPRRAQILIYGLQVASQNAKHTSGRRSVETVRDAYEDTDGELVGPRWQQYDVEDIDSDDDDEEEDGEEQPSLARYLMSGEPAPAGQPESGKVDKIQAKAEADGTPPVAPQPKLRTKSRPASKTGNKTGNKAEHKPCRTFLPSADAPLIRLNPRVPSSDFRRLARQQILSVMHPGVELKNEENR